MAPVAGVGSPEQRLRTELRRIRDSVSGVHGSLVATNDGFLVAHDVPDLEPTAIAALAATTRSLASRTALSTGRGQFREAVARGSQGYLAVYAAGGSALIAVIGTPDLNIAMLHYQTREIAERIAAVATEFGAWSAMAATAVPTAPPAQPGSQVQPGGAVGRAEPLPRRRPAGPARTPRFG